jgi:hypothetical protein
MHEHRKHNVGKSNYASKSIQPWDIWKEYNLNPWDADIVKRILRTKDVAGEDPMVTRLEDYEKIIHICQERISHIRDDMMVASMEDEMLADDARG